MRLSVRIPFAALALAAFAGSAPAQLSMDVGLSLGLYAPGGFYNTNVACACPSTLPQGPRAASIGGQVRFWVTPSIGLQFAAAASNPYAFGGENMPNLSTTPVVAAQVRSASVQALLGLTGDSRAARAWLGLGVGVIQHYGQAYQPFGSPTNLAGAVTLGGSVRVAGGLNLDAGVSSLIYQMPLYWSGINMSHGTQFDLAFTTGLSWHFE